MDNFITEGPDGFSKLPQKRDKCSWPNLCRFGQFVCLVQKGAFPFL